MTNKLQTLKGFRDFLPQQALERSFLISTMRGVFERFGFDPLETPALEYSDVLLGKNGDEADKLVYTFTDKGGRKVGLRYDQTVPTARVIGQYFQTLTKPFKRYQIQLVWRAERPQKGRYREFIQCDADIIGEAYPPIADAETIAVFYSIYKAVGLKNFNILINSRIILRQMINTSCNNVALREDDFLSVVRSIDKLDKIGLEGIAKELEIKKIPNLDIDYLINRIKEYSNFDVENIDAAGDGSLKYSIQMATENFGVPREIIKFSPTLARGLNYYTSLIFELVVDGYPGSLGGGGRYDNLIKQLGGPQTPAVGFAIGFDRTLEIAREQGLIPNRKTATTVLVAYLDDGKKIFPFALNLVNQLRQSSINAEIYLDPKEKDLDKQLKYADKKGIPYVVIIGPEEAAKNTVKLKTMATQTQEELALPELIEKLTNA